MNFLQVQNVDLCYGQFQALFDISLTVAAGETVAIVGANGAGKTSLLRLIAGAHMPARGQVSLRETVVSGQPAHVLARRGIALVPEGRMLFPSLSVEENLVIGNYVKRHGHWNLEKIYSLFPSLKERRHNASSNISGGQQQMVAIARALMSNPTLILMDEISLGLAPLVVEELYRVVKQIANAGTTVVLVEQDVRRGLKAADRVYCLLEGKISLSGKSTEVTMDQISRAYFGV
jgi:branched-chain amino acid transport system ATP-binding protein